MSCATLLWPEGMNPTRNNARSPMGLRGTERAILSPRAHSLPLIFLVQRYWGSALLEAEFTTERAQQDFRCCLADRAKEGTSRFYGKPGVLGLERKIVLHPAHHGVGAEIGRDIRRHQGLDITGVGGELVVAAGAKITIVENPSTAGIRLHQRSGDRLQMDVATDGRDLNVSVANIRQCDRPAHPPDVHMTIP